MSYITVILSHDPNDWISRVIAWATFGNVTHVALRSPDCDEVIEASSFGAPRGVRVMAYSVFAANHPGHRLLRIPHPAPRQVWGLAKSQIGKPYDYRYYLGWLFRRNWQQEDAWVCQELICWAAAHAGKAIFAVDSWRISPRDFELLQD